MTRTRLLIQTLGLVLALATACWATAQAPPESEADIRKALAEADGRYELLRKAVNRPGVLPAFEITDSRGKSFQYDLARNVLTPAAVAEIERLRESIAAQLGSEQLEPAKKSLQAYIDALRTALAVYKAIDAYWSSGAAQRPDRGPYLGWLLKNGLEPRYPDEIKEATETFDRQIGEAKFAEAVERTYPVLKDLIAKASKEEDVAIREALAERELAPFMERKNTDACKDAATETSGKNLPKMTRGGTGVDDYYPAASKRISEQGKVYLLARVSAQGCVERGMVLVSSGFPRLDAAALRLLLDSRFLPAEEDGHAIAADVPFAMNWTLE